MGVLFQIIATVLLCFSCVNIGLIYSWPSSTILLFKSENTTLHRPMGDMEIALFGSLPAIGSLVGHPLAAIALNVLGRKRTVILTALPFVMSWSIITITNRVEAILTAAIISGTGYGLFMAVTIYISEISQDSIRGTLTACPNQFAAVGILASYFIGGALEYHALAYTCLSLAVIAVVMIAVLKESPVSLMAKEREEDAANSLAFYRRNHCTSNEVRAELSNIRRALYFKSTDVQSSTTVQEKISPGCETSKVSCWKHFKTSQPTRRQFYLVMVLKTAFLCQGLPVVQIYAEPMFTEAVETSQPTRRQFYLVMVLKTAFLCQGLPVVQIYAEPMFTEAVGDIISPNLCSVILGLVVIVAGVIAAYLVDVLGRRHLIICSSIAAGISCVVLGTQLVTEWLPKWTVPLFMYIYATSHVFGAGTVPFVVGAEVFLPEVKSILLMLAVQWSWICNFCFVFLFNIVVQAVGLFAMFFLFSFVCFATAVYFFYFLPETKGLPVYAIQELFANKENRM